MKEKSQIEKKAEEKQTELLSAALGGASNAGGHWLNVSGKGFPRVYPQGVSASPFNALFMALHSDNNGCKTNLFTLYSETKARGAAVREHEQGVPFLFYNWNKYVNRNNPNETIDRTAYLQLDEEQKAQFKGVHNRGQAGLRGCGKAGRQCSGKRICRGGQPQVAHSVQRLSIEDAGQPRSRALGR